MITFRNSRSHNQLYLWPEGGNKWHETRWSRGARLRRARKTETRKKVVTDSAEGVLRYTRDVRAVGGGAALVVAVVVMVIR